MIFKNFSRTYFDRSTLGESLADDISIASFESENVSENKDIAKDVAKKSTWKEIPQILYSYAISGLPGGPDRLRSRERLMEIYNEAADEIKRHGFDISNDKFQEFFRELGVSSGLNQHDLEELIKNAQNIANKFQEEDEERKKLAADQLSGINQSSRSVEETYVDEASAAWKFRVMQFALMCTGIGGISFLSPILHAMGSLLDAADIGHEIFNLFSKIPGIGHVAGALGWGVAELPIISDLNELAQNVVKQTPLSLAPDILTPILDNPQLQGAAAGLFLFNGAIKDLTRLRDVNKKRDGFESAAKDVFCNYLKSFDELKVAFDEHIPEMAFNSIESSIQRRFLAEKLLEIDEAKLQKLHEIYSVNLPDDQKSTFFSIALELKNEGKKGQKSHSQSILEICSDLLGRENEMKKNGESLQTNCLSNDILQKVAVFEAINEALDQKPEYKNFAVPVVITDKNGNQTQELKTFSNHSPEAKLRIINYFERYFQDSANTEIPFLSTETINLEKIKRELLEPAKEKFEQKTAAISCKQDEAVKDVLLQQLAKVGNNSVDGNSDLQGVKDAWVKNFQQQIKEKPGIHPARPSAIPLRNSAGRSRD